jgi:branched-chain amino acid transport system substrate-binding protein
MIARSLLAAAAIAALGGSALAADPVRIGYGISKSGRFAPVAQSQIQAYELWAEEIKAKGGLDIAGQKRPIEFVVYDDQSDFGKAPAIYEKLITSDKVDLLLAPWGTPFHFAIAGVLEKYKFPMVGNTAASVALRDVKPGYIWFPTAAIPDRIAAELVKMLQAEGVKSVAVTMLQLPFSQEIKKSLIPELEKAQVKIAVNEEYAPGVKDLTATLTKIKQASPDAVLSLSYPPDSILYMKQARELGISAPFQLVLIGPTADFFGKMFGANLDGIVTVGHWSPVQTKWPKAKPFFDAFVKKFGEKPDYLDTSLPYMSVEILEQAVKKAGLDREKLRQTIASDTFETINGLVKFQGVQNAITPTMLLQFQKGEAQIVWPPAEETAKFMPKPAWPQ